MVLYNLVDVHAHLASKEMLDKIDEVLDRARQAGIVSVITNGVEPNSNRKCLELSKKHGLIKAALGIYPIDVLRKEAASGEYPDECVDFNWQDELKFIEANANRIVAIGEVGLDFVDSDESGRAEQEEVFREAIRLAKRINKPLIVHSRAAELRVIEVLMEEEAKKVVMHCFSGRKNLVKRIIENGWSLSIPTNVVRNPQFQEAVRLCPISQLLTETDSPWLSPFKDKRNEPAFITESIRIMAQLKGLDEQELTSEIFKNYQKMFDFG